MTSEQKRKTESYYAVYDKTPSIILSTSPEYTISDVLYTHTANWEQIGIYLTPNRSLIELIEAIKSSIPDPQLRGLLYEKAFALCNEVAATND